MNNKYAVRRDSTGKVTTITRDDGAEIALVEGNRDFDEFLKWDAAQEKPLDRSDKQPEPPTFQDRRRIEYEKQGVTIEALTVALWEKMVEGRSAAADELQRKRDAIKEQFPAQTAQTVKG